MADEPSDSTVKTRGYQQEMLEESLKRNIIIAMGTGSGKTHIAVLRMKIEAEREPHKLSWFLAPTVVLCEQQKGVIEAALPVNVGLISGSLEPEQWKNAELWRSVIASYRIMVTTPQVLLDALRHGYINMGQDIGLIIFDEVHNATGQAPYSRIMQEFYFACPPRAIDSYGDKANVRPQIMGLTASPIFGGNVVVASQALEETLDCTIRSPRRTREELGQFVHIPVFKHILYCSEPSFSTNLASFDNIFRRLDIEADPYVKSLRKKLAKTTPDTPEWKRLDQTLSKTVDKKKTYTHSGLQHVSETGRVICSEIGPWAADWYICRVLELAKTPLDTSSVVSDLNHSERGYLLKILDKVVVSPVSFEPEDIVDDVSDKVRHLVECLRTERTETEDRNEAYSCLIFVERREAVLVLAEVLSHHPDTKGIFKVGTLVGGADNAYKSSPLDITRTHRKVQDITLTDFKIGEKNVIVSTSVAEEGIDIRACCSVIRFDPPKNMAGWAQSRGRARKQRSNFTVMFDEDAANRKNVNDWERLEAEMVAHYNDPSRDFMPPATDDYDDEDDDSSVELKVESTGARLSLHGVISHLNHFCAVIPNSSHIDHKPIFDVDPPEMPEGWHSFENRTTAITPYPGPFGAKVTLPRLLPSELRFFETERIHRSKLSAFRHVAMEAYKALYENGLLNDNLLPLTSVGDPSLEEEVQALLKEVEKRAGTARVSIQMDPWSPADETTGWYSSEIVITGLPPLLLFTRVRPAEWSDKTAPILHRIGWQGSVTLRHIAFDSSPGTIARARDYTRRLFWCINGSRMNWEDLDFSYLFLPPPGSDDAAWDSRRSWHAQCDLRGDSPLLANALALGEQFSYPNDLSLIRNGPKFNKAYKFVRWRFEPLNAEEEEDYKTLYARFPNIEITYPLLVVENLPPRTNFLIPIPENANLSASPKTLHLLPRLAYAALVSEAEVQYAFLLPSALRSLAMAMTVDSLRDTLFSNSDLASLPQQLLITAMSAPVSQEKSDYQRLETLGDTVLKFMSSLQFLGEYPLWHEGYLTHKMGHCVSNGRLAKANIAHGLYRWIIRDRMLGKKWKPSYFTFVDMMEDSTTTEVEDEDMDRKKRKKGTQDLSTKVLADVVESLIGAFYLHGGFPLALQCAQFFDLGIKWQPLPARIEAMLNRVETHDELPSQLDSVEEMLGYTFTRKLLLVEALTHASYQQDLRTISYERLEFAGDAVLDMIVTEYLFRAEGKDYSPGHMFHRKSAMVNASILAFFCLGTHIDKDAQMPRATGGSLGNREFTLRTQTEQIYLWQCLLHSNSRILDDQRTAFARYNLRREEIDEGLQRGRIFPWAALTRLQAPKFLSDMIESLIGAVFLDSSGNLDTVGGVLRKLGWMQVLERIVCADVDVLHPVSQMSNWASKNGKKLAYEFVKEKGEISCAVSIDGEEVESTRVSDRYQGKLTRDEVRLVAAEKAIVEFRLRDVNANYTALKRKTTKKRKRSSSSASILNM